LFRILVEAMWHSGRKSQRRQSAILPASIRSFFLLAAAIARSFRGCATFTFPHAEAGDRRSTGKDRRVHSDHAGLGKRLDPAV
jgi:hypothetical protein